MRIITTTKDLKEFCQEQDRSSFITVDTEFLRDRTYWPQLCLVQVAGKDSAAIIDPLAKDIDLSSLYDLLFNKKILKVFHAGRQDIEIFVHLTGQIPTPVFDTQIAAMVCGFGESVGYDTLVKSITGEHVNKSSRFTDWSKRPLTPEQQDYALGDVTHLRVVYEHLSQKLKETRREKWTQEAYRVLLDKNTYFINPEETWRRVKTRSKAPRFLAILREITKWRELQAQQQNVPRNHFLSETILNDLAGHPPKKPEQLAHRLKRKTLNAEQTESLFQALKKGQALDKQDCPSLPQPLRMSQKHKPVLELLKVLLKLKCTQHHVALSLVANSADLELITEDDKANVPALSGWRYKIFGQDALALKHGKLSLSIKDHKISLTSL